MANTNAPFGFKPIKSATGGASVSVEYFTVASGAARIGKGDLVALNSSGFIVRETSAVAVGPWLGVSLIGMSASAGVGGIAQFPICNDPSAIYEVQASTAAIAQTDIGTILKVDAHTAPDTNTNLSKSVLTSTAATAANGVFVLRLAQRSDNAFGASAILEVRINKSMMTPGAAGV